MVNFESIKENILSNESILEICNSGKWSYHGSSIIELFIDMEMELEYANSKARYQVIKKYLSDKIDDVIEDIIDESPEYLFRTIYLGETPKLSGYFGVYWSSRDDTNACVQPICNKKEYMLCIQYEESLIDWVETIKSRVDYLYGEREKEFHLKKNQEVELFYFQEI